MTALGAHRARMAWVYGPAVMVGRVFWHCKPCNRFWPCNAHDLERETRLHLSTVHGV
jgi:hypothetical protein